jgi:deazaflavin-dependent oxidoreductase (nitroreductase family)
LDARQKEDVQDITVKWVSSLHTLAYRITAGRIGGRLVANDMLLLTTRGRDTGGDHTVPLLYLRDRDTVVVIASYGGRPDHPDWYLNLQEHPEVTIQIDGMATTGTTRTMAPEEREQWWPRVVDAYADYEVYQSRTSREIPIVAIE